MYWNICTNSILIYFNTANILDLWGYIKKDTYSKTPSTVPQRQGIEPCKWGETLNRGSIHRDLQIKLAFCGKEYYTHSESGLNVQY